MVLIGVLLIVFAIIGVFILVELMRVLACAMVMLIFFAFVGI